MSKPSGKTIFFAACITAVAGIGLLFLYARERPEVLIALTARMDPELWSAARYTDPEKAGEDYAIQGEYAAPGVPWGVQVVAQGEGRFEARILPGGLPGAGGEPNGSFVVSGRRESGPTRLSGAAQLEIQDGALTLEAPDGKSYMLPRIERTSPTLGQPPPPGALVLFDGETNLFDGDVDLDGHLMEGAQSLEPFGDFRLHLEFRTPFEPTLSAQSRGNSGVYIQKRYEVQILDSFGLEGGEKECGAIYKLRAPAQNMALPPLQWQTYDIDFTAAEFDGETKTAPARISVWQNGVLTHEDVVLPGPTGAGAPETSGSGLLLLQDHGHPVRYRNIWIEPSPKRP